MHFSMPPGKNSHARSSILGGRGSFLIFVAALRRAACGGSDHMPGGGGTNPPRGTLLQDPELVSTIPAATLLLELRLAANQQLLTLSGTPVCDIVAYHFRYATVGGANEYATASGALMIPTGVDSRCRGSRPI